MIETLRLIPPFHHDQFVLAKGKIVLLKIERQESKVAEIHPVVNCDPYI